MVLTNNYIPPTIQAVLNSSHSHKIPPRRQNAIQSLPQHILQNFSCF